MRHDSLIGGGGYAVSHGLAIQKNMQKNKARDCRLRNEKLSDEESDKYVEANLGFLASFNDCWSCSQEATSR